MKNKKVFFLHIPRTMGAALKVQCLAPNYRQDEMMLDLRWDDGLKMTEWQHEHIKLICGHIGVNIASILGCQVPIMTMLRDPFHLAMSMYRLTRLAQWHYLHDLAARMSFAEFIADPQTSKLIANIQARFITNNVDYHTLAASVKVQPTRNNMDQAFYSIESPSDADLLEKALKKIREFFFVGIADRFYDSVNSLWDIMGIADPKLGPDMAIQMNPTLRSNIHPRICTVEYDALSKINQVDLELYKHASKWLPKYTGNRFGHTEKDRI